MSNKDDIEAAVEDLRRLAKVMADPKTKFRLGIIAGIVMQLLEELEREHERVLAWRVLGTDAYTIWLSGESIGGWLAAYERQLAKDSDEGCLK